tara:strand:- start:565 stop:750 length:186 start_codon:yes stop_codon:yes gene_type:complete
MTTTSGTTSVVLLVSKHTLKTTLDDKKVDYKWTTILFKIFKKNICNLIMIKKFNNLKEKKK